METLDGNVANHTGMSLTPRGINALAKAAGWGKFISIVGISVVGIYLIIALIGLMNVISLIRFAPQSVIMMVLMMGFYVLVLLCCIKMMQFSFAASRAVNMHSSQDLENALVKLKAFFSLSGIVTIIGIAIAIVGFLVLLAFGMALGGGGFGRGF